MRKHISPMDTGVEKAKQIVVKNGLIVVPITIVLQLQCSVHGERSRAWNV